MDMKIEPRIENGWKGDTPAPVQEKNTSSQNSKSSEAENAAENQKSASETQNNADMTIMSSGQTSLKFDLEKTVDKNGRTGSKLVVSVIDEETGEVLRQIPPDEFSRQISNGAEIKGLMLDKKG
jgi:uncharacterized FlaG/YvyC family protein